VKTDWQPPAVGDLAERTYTFTDADVQAFANLTGVQNPLHLDDAFVAATRLLYTARQSD
jgi:acyl dehydratase